jgi:branched-chain amino acid aminotransferase
VRTTSLVGKEDGRAQYIWRNGDIVPWEEATIHVRSVGHASVSSVFEGVKAYWNDHDKQLYVFRLREHVRRLLESLKIVRLKTDLSLADLVQGVIDILRANEVRTDTYVRPWTFIRGIVYEQIAPANVPTETIIDTWPFSTTMLTERGCNVCVSSWTRITDNVMPPRVKAFSNYHNSRMAAMEATQNGYDWPLILNERSKLTEGPGACVAIVRDGKVVTPAISSGLMESITRATAIQLFQEALHTPVSEREIDRTELYICDEAFFVGTGWEVLPILSVDGLPVGDGKMGSITKNLDQVYHDIVRGIDSQHAEWRTPVWT